MIRDRFAHAAFLSALLTAHAAQAGVNFIGTDLVTVSRNPKYMVSGDMNSDGRADVVVVGARSREVFTFLAADSPSNFAAGRVERFGNALRDLVLADVNRDNRLDVIVADAGAHGVWVLLGRGDGTYLEPYPVLVPQSRNPVSVAVANWDQLGGPDLAVADRRDNKVFILLNDNGTPPRFRQGGVVLAGQGIEEIRAADMNRDGVADLVSFSPRGPGANGIGVTLFKGVVQGGFPQFGSTINYVVGENPTQLVIADLNADGGPDVAMLNRPVRTGKGVRRSDIDVMLSEPNGVLMPALSLETSCPFLSNRACIALTMTAGDYDDTGFVDLAVTFSDRRGSSLRLADAMQIFGGRGDGAFVPGPVFTIGKAPQSMTSGDISGDGKVDIAIAYQRSLSLQAFINISSPGPGARTPTPFPTSTATETETPMATPTATPEAVLVSQTCNLLTNPTPGQAATASNLALGIYALPIPLTFALDGSLLISAGAVDPSSGQASSNCEIGTLAPVNIPSIGFVCITTASGPCAPTKIDCDGGSPLDVEIRSDGNVGACTGEAACETLCDTHCASIGAVQQSSGCTGYCSEGSGKACVSDAECLPNDGACNGPDPVGNNFDICQCQCVNGAVGAPARPGDFQCNLGSELVVENQPPCDGTDIRIKIGTTCVALTTSTASTLITDANFQPGTTVPRSGVPAAGWGTPVTCENFAAGDVGGLRIRGVVNFFGSALGDIAMSWSADCAGPVD